MLALCQPPGSADEESSVVRSTCSALECMGAIGRRTGCTPTQHECPAQKEDYQHSLERSGTHQIDSMLGYLSGFQTHRGGTDECQYDAEGHLISLHFRSSGENNVVDDYVEAGVVRMVDNGASVTDQLADLGVLDPERPGARRGASNYTGIDEAALAAMNRSVVPAHCRMVRGPRMLLWTRASALFLSRFAPVGVRWKLR